MWLNTCGECGRTCPEPAALGASRWPAAEHLSSSLGLWLRAAAVWTAASPCTGTSGAGVARLKHLGQRQL